MAPTPQFDKPNHDHPHTTDGLLGPQHPFLHTPDGPLSPQNPKEDVSNGGLSEMAFWYMVLLLSMLLTWLLLFFCLRIISIRQKTRNQTTRRMYVGTRARPSSLPSEQPTIYVSPANLPPPPKYEAMMAPPSYEEVVGIHYPNYQVTRVTQIQPITRPITAALSGTNVIENANNVISNANNAINNAHQVANNANNVVSNASNIANNSSNVANNVVNARIEDALPTVVTVESERRTSVSVATATS